MSALLSSTAIVAIAEIGDKTQLLSLVLAARFRRPLPIMAGILIATLANHALAAWLGAQVAAAIGPALLRWTLAVAFFAIALWALRPDSLEGSPAAHGRWGAFVASLVAFFIAEIGDKTQLATVALAARYDALVAVVIGTTLGMMIANVPVVLLGEKVMQRVSLKVIRWIAAALFFVMGIAVLVGS
jgi:putative Ca2+/H+ antiporter (TMEM165/GDT1 family)